MLRILIIDDHPDTADAICMLLETFAHTTQAEYTGRAGLAAFETFCPDLVILDIGLPDLSGYEVARAIRALPGGGRIHLVAATGWGTTEDRVLALAAGFDQHQLKPLDFVKLEQAIAGATARIKAYRRLASDPA